MSEQDPRIAATLRPPRTTGPDPLPRGVAVPIPSALRVSAPSTTVYDLVVLGAGCAGLSLGVDLVAAGMTGSVLLVDSRVDYADDRTWCFWSVEETPFDHLARAAWPTWTVRSGDGVAASSAPATPYRYLAANDFYRDALATLAESSRFGLLADTVVLGIESTGADGLVTVVTTSGTAVAREVVDSRGLRPDAAEIDRARESSTWLQQEFVGLHVRAHRPVFDPGSCMLMDFDVDQSGGLRFVYVLPLSATEALVEDVSMATTVPTRGQHRDDLDDYLERRYGLGGGDYDVLSAERGNIPMTSHPFRRHPNPHVTTLGTLAGATRPSTGYTFLTIQRSSRRLAQRLAARFAEGGAQVEAGAGAQEPGLTEPDSRCGPLDAIFLRFLADFPEDAPRVFHLLFSRVPAEALVRFLSERGSLVDHVRLVFALPWGKFLIAAGRELLGRIARRGRR